MMNRIQAKYQCEWREGRWDGDDGGGDHPWDMTRTIADLGGEGSRGGKIIGHTSSGKPIYMNHSHPSHEKFNQKDHMEAATLHGSKVPSEIGSVSKENFENVMAHVKAETFHTQQVMGKVQSTKQGPSEIMLKKAEKNLAAHTKFLEQNKEAIIERQKRSGAYHTKR